ncbi:MULTISPECIES: hypothetical protein [Chromobacterium]|uniref:Uncharacterized protein n=1 Tax=Chromobacterium sphagni TaxID=1903179 RepID=A0ABX3CBS8_9NEIS|nr:MULTISPECIES: hypothetical protein [Chromobacterium]OHX19674.1 hypothetical protein BI344_17090 [Chromobacterium sphagni]
MKTEGSNNRVAQNDYNEQNINGDITNQSPFFNNNNVINLHVDRSGEELLSGELLTLQQQNEIRDLVRQLANASGRDMEKVWRSFSNQFHGKMYKDLPIEWFREAYSWLKKEIYAAEHKASKKTANDVAAPSYSAYTQPALRYKTVCEDCVASAQALSEAQRSVKVLIAISVLAIGISISLGYLSHTSSAQASALKAQLQSQQHECNYQGQRYRLGSIIDFPNAPDIQCLAGQNGQVAYWQPLHVAHKLRKR